MTRLTPGEMAGVQPISNMCIIRIDSENDKVKLESGVELYVDTTYEPGKHAIRTGVVHVPPRRLSYSLNSTEKIGLEWETDIEVGRGDVVYFDYLTAHNADKLYDGRHIYILLPYHRIYARRDGDNLVPLNGYVVGTKTKKQKKFGDVVLHYVDDFEMNILNVAFVGKPNKKYFVYMSDGRKRILPDKDINEHISPGDNVVYKGIALPIEYSLHSTLDDDYYLIQGRYIMGIIK